MNAIGTPLPGPVKSGLTRWRFAVYVGAVAESGSKHQLIRFSISVENRRAAVGRDGRTCRARPNSQARTGTGRKRCFPVQLTTSRISNLKGFVHTQLYVMIIHIRLKKTSRRHHFAVLYVLPFRHSLYPALRSSLKESQSRPGEVVS